MADDGVVDWDVGGGTDWSADSGTDRSANLWLLNYRCVDWGTDGEVDCGIGWSSNRCIYWSINRAVDGSVVVDLYADHLQTSDSKQLNTLVIFSPFLHSTNMVPATTSFQLVICHLEILDADIHLIVAPSQTQ